MLEMRITFPGGTKVDAEYDEFSVRTDQSVASGGDGSAPQPFDLFLASIGTCAGYYVKAFCETRGIEAQGLDMRLKVVPDQAAGRLACIEIEIGLPAGFPEKYRRAVARAADLCAVKRHIVDPPEFKTTTRPGAEKSED